MNDVAVPRLNTNDDSYVLVEWLVTDGQPVRAGDPVAVVETSKAAEELACAADGVVQRLLAVDSECRPGDVLARVFASEQERLRAGAGSAADADAAQPVLTDAARALAQEAGVSADALRALGKPIVRREDVAGLLAPGTPSPSAERPGPGRAQRAVAAVVAESHRTIPPAVAVMKVTVGAALETARTLTRRTRIMVGLPELLVKATAHRRPEFPEFFGAGQTADVGVTVDVGAGLFVPVVPDAERLSCADIADLMTDFRQRAGGGGFRPDELSGANIMVALHNDVDVVLAVPIVFPGQVAVLSLGGVYDEVFLDSAGQVNARRVTNLGLVYDHRIVNGRNAVRFLQAIKATLEQPTEFVDGWN
jgi:2-oxoglutarate dehydrogenase E2 component (dihydrolipoamide succinyltransferase)